MTGKIKKYSQVVLLGDSLTQVSSYLHQYPSRFECISVSLITYLSLFNIQFSFSTDGGWGSLLAARLQRICDVLCRGLAGFNSKWLLQVLPELIDGVEASRVSCVLIFLGANDCAHADCQSSQHVPLAEYQENLKKIVQFLDSKGIKKERVIMVNPPPYYHEQFVATKSDSPTAPRRSSEAAYEYSLACLKAATEIGVTAVDIHTEFKNDSRGSDLFCDGLHFSPAGAKVLFDTIWPSVGKKIMEYYETDSLDQMFPYWMEIASKDKAKKQDSINEDKTDDSSTKQSQNVDSQSK